MRTLPFLNGMSEKEVLNTSASLDDTAWEYKFDLPTPAPRPSLLGRQTPGSSASFHPHTRSRGPVVGVGSEYQTPPDIRIARWRRIDRKVSQQRRRSEVFTQNRANSDTSLLYNLQFSEEENLSFGELRTFEDSYNLAEPEPEPVLDPVILNFIPVPAEVEPDMADQNVEAILQADPQPPPLVPDPGAQNIEGGGK